MLAKVASGAIFGFDAVPVTVEVDVASRGLPSLSIVGLADKAIQEAKERIRAAISNSGIEFPARRITINLAPADLPKQGPVYDLPLALGILFAMGALTPPEAKTLFIGELSLDGGVNAVSGILPIALMAKKFGFTQLFVPCDNADEAALIKGISVFPVPSLISVVSHLQKVEALSPHPHFNVTTLIKNQPAPVDMAEIHGQENAKRALEIAAAGFHNVLLKGVPGAGKTMLAKAFIGILPPLTVSEALELTRIYSVAGELTSDQPLVLSRPFRNPHHTTSKVGLIGGSSHPKPGEISLAHRGVLFLDEFPEFPRDILESLRQPLEDGKVHISRALLSFTFPSKFMLMAAANPCPCGHLGSSQHPCTCSTAQIQRYSQRISGPILDRIDLHLDVASVEIEKLVDLPKATETSEAIRQRVIKAHQQQLIRFKPASCRNNAEMTTKQVHQFCPLGDKEKSFLARAASKLKCSARTYFKTIKVARTIADLEQSDRISTAHLAEALQYRYAQPVY